MKKPVDKQASIPQPHSKINRYLTALLDRLDGYTKHFWISLLILILVDALAVPYAGITHDARLYSLQALFHLNPSHYVHDLFFLFGSQDDYSIFSFLHAFSIDLFGLYGGTWLLYIISRIVYLGGMLFLFRTILKRSAISFLAAYFVSACFIHYIFFDVNEPYLTPRILSAGLSLFAIAFLLRKSIFLSFSFLFATFLFHPIMAIGPGAFVVTLLLINGNIKKIGLLFIGGTVVLGIFLGIFPEWFQKLHFFTVMDDTWREIIFSRSEYLAPLEWTSEEWRSVAASIIFTLLCTRLLQGEPRRLILVAGLIFTMGILLTCLVTYFIHLAFPIQIQLWRSYWLFRIISIAFAFLLGGNLWAENRYSSRLASVMIILPACLYGGITDDSLFWLLCAGCLALFPIDLDRVLSAPMKKIILGFLCLIILFIPAFYSILNFIMYFSITSLHATLFSFIAALGPFFGLVSLAFIFWVFCMKVPKRILSPLVAFALIFVTWTGPASETNFPTQIEHEKFLFKPSDSNILSVWGKIIPPGSMVLTTGIVPVNSIWFDLQSSLYVSWVQGAGILFSRELALEWQKRYQKMENLADMQDKETLINWCRQEGIDYIFCLQALPLKLVSIHNRIRLFQVSPD